MEIFDVRTRQWRQGPPLPSARCDHSSFVFQGQLVVAGGTELGTNKIPPTLVYQSSGEWLLANFEVQRQLEAMAPMLNSIACFEQPSQMWVDTMMNK